MGKKLKRMLFIVGAMVVVLAVCLLILMIPSVANWTAGVTNKSVAAVKNFAVTVATIAVGGIFVFLGLTVAAALPVVGIALVVVGLAIAGWGIYTSGWFSSSSSSVPIDNKSQLNRVA